MNIRFLVIAVYLINLSISHAFTNDSMVKSKKMNTPIQLSAFERNIAAKIALDIRYFCPEITAKKTVQCLQGVTTLHQDLADMITNTGIGSVVLFAENLESTKQIIHLTHDLQQAALKSKSAKPLIISIDQEGGRVARLPQATSFAGNMAIGATYHANDIKFATQTSKVIAQELKLLGINNNYAPVIDVNTNADNPVINTRSFGENPQWVAELGSAAVNGFQQQKVMATLKHFPGHGDTHVDSHLDLPLVEHDLATIEKQDIAPFKWAIKHSSPAMIMTAHIQYPALDNSTVLNNLGEKIIRPATMSRKILTDLLRNDMKFDGIIATDALDMAGISHYFDDVSAVVETFVAGADLAVMPFKIRQPSDIAKFSLFIKSVAKMLQTRIDKGEFSLAELNESTTRINHYKAQYSDLSTQTLLERVNLAEQKIAQVSHLLLEQTLADNSVTLLKSKQNILPIATNKIKRIHLFVWNWQEFRALKQAIKNNWHKLGKTLPKISATVVSSGDALTQLKRGKKLAKADLLIATVDTKIASVVDLGGAEDLLTKAKLVNENNSLSYGKLLKLQLQQAKLQHVTSVLIAKGSPYLLQPYQTIVDAVLVTFDDRIYQDVNNQAYSPGFNTSIGIVIGKQRVLGELPVSLSNIN